MRKHINIIERIERAALELRDDECWLTSLTKSRGVTPLSVAIALKAQLHRCMGSNNQREAMRDASTLIILRQAGDSRGIAWCDTTGRLAAAFLFSVL